MKDGGIMINIDVSVQNVMYVEKIVFRVLLHVIVKMENIQQVFFEDSAIMCDEIIESYEEETDFNEKKKQLVTRKFYIFCLHFY